MNILSLKPVGLVGLLVATGLNPISANAGDGYCEQFTDISIILEQNATDGDSEVVAFAKGQDIGLDKFSVRAPDGRKIAKFNGDKRGIGMREFLLESAEPPELDKVLASFPEGEYTFKGRTVEGGCLSGTAYLSHILAPETIILSPAAEEVINRNSVSVSWMPIGNATAYVVELKNEETEDALVVNVPATVTTFDAPASWLVADTEYQVAVTAITATGNRTSVENTFFTAM